MAAEDEEETSLLEPYGPKPCASLQKVCFGLGHVYNDLCAAVWFSYTLFYFQVIVEMDATTAGTLIMIGQVADSMATPAAGWAVDWIGTPRAWHLTGTAVVTLSFSLIFSVSPGSGWGATVYYATLIVVFQIGWAIVQISHLTVITNTAKSHKHSADLTAIRYTASVCCNILVYILTWTILQSEQLENIGPADFYKFKEVVLIITGVGIFCSAIYYCGVDGVQTNGEVEETSAEKKRNGNGASFLRSLVTYQVSLMYMSSRLYTTLNLIYIPLYLKERYDEQTAPSNADTVRSAIATVPLVCFMASFFTSMLLNNRPERLNDKHIYGFGGVLSLIGCAWIAIGVPQWTGWQIYGVASIIGIGGSATMVASLCLTAQFVNSNGFKGGSVYSTITFTDKLISGAVILIIQQLQCEDKKLCPDFYEIVLAYATGCAALLGFLSLVTMQLHNPNMV